MASNLSQSRHLDATSGREVVYCHQCQHEWSILKPIPDQELEILYPTSIITILTAALIPTQIRTRTRLILKSISPVALRAFLADAQARQLLVGLALTRCFLKMAPRVSHTKEFQVQGSAVVFGNIFGGIGPPPMAPRSPGRADDANNRDADRDMRQQDIAMALNQIFSSFLNPHAVQGDAVYSQEALDRIITNLMEANPQSNAPPPASEDAIKHLPKKKLDAEMLGPELKGECTICIDDMGVGDEVTVLPCQGSQRGGDRIYEAAGKLA
ncbi:putative ring finger domain-containing protein [Eutypa lata UCREL1]|uniref:Putative ring finger domain-containing protein n=1 Tax=Eutypa lata (strain UCR-EL1) TaxID=1287681 RepID=M7TJN3_EUTLA|nr:putative ring finger domain-containing protein [Eutypa lata UCREL1]